MTPDDKELRLLLERHRVKSNRRRGMWGVLGLATLFLGGLLFFGWLDHLSEVDCASKGGEWTHVGRGSVCLRPGSVVK